MQFIYQIWTIDLVYLHSIVDYGIVLNLVAWNWALVVAHEGRIRTLDGGWTKSKAGLREVICEIYFYITCHVSA
jgi:hypothetical protein